MSTKKAINRSGEQIDLLTISIYFALVIFGWLMIYSVGYGTDGYPYSWSTFLFKTTIGKQTLWVFISLFLGFIIYLIDWKFWRTFAYPMYGLGILSLLGLFVFGKVIHGASSWYGIGSFTLQPSELVKFTTALAVASFLSPHSANLRGMKTILITFGLFLVPALLILGQPDAGSALVFMAFLMPMYREGFSRNFFVIVSSLTALILLSLIFDPLTIIFFLAMMGIVFLITQFRDYKQYAFASWGTGIFLGSYLIYYDLAVFAVGGAAIAFLIIGGFQYLSRRTRAIGMTLIATIVACLLAFGTNYSFNNFLKKHQRNRINVWLKPDQAAKGTDFNLVQSKTAIANGGLTGQGFLNGPLTKGEHVPEQTTDFIFCTVGEEHGFLGVTGIILFFVVLMYRITIIAERQRSNFSRIYAYSVVGILLVHILINIGMTMGLMPIIGIPLPFISKGGSSLMGFSIMIAVLLKLDTYRYTV